MYKKAIKRACFLILIFFSAFLNAGDALEKMEKGDLLDKKNQHEVTKKFLQAIERIDKDTFLSLLKEEAVAIDQLKDFENKNKAVRKRLKHEKQIYWHGAVAWGSLLFYTIIDSFIAHIWFTDTSYEKSKKINYDYTKNGGMGIGSFMGLAMFYTHAEETEERIQKTEEIKKHITQELKERSRVWHV